MKQLIAPISFLIFISCIILLANMGYGPNFWSFLNYIPYGDKICHFVLYGLMTVAIEKLFNFKQLGRGAIFALLFVIIEEFSQILFSTRTFSIADLFWSIAGVTIFEIIILLKQIKSIFPRD